MKTQLLLMPAFPYYTISKNKMVFKKIISQSEIISIEHYSFTKGVHYIDNSQMNLSRLNLGEILILEGEFLSAFEKAKSDLYEKL